MRSFQTFILRLYRDTEAPARLCGDLQAMPGRKSFPFQSEAGMIDLLRRFISEENYVFKLMPSSPEDKLDQPGVKDSVE